MRFALLVCLGLLACNKTQETRVNALAQSACEEYVVTSPKAQALAAKAETPVQALAQYVCQDATVLGAYAQNKGAIALDELLARLAQEADAG